MVLVCNVWFWVTIPIPINMMYYAWLQDWNMRRKVISTQNVQGLSIANIFKAIGDDMSLVLFNTIAIEAGDSDILMTRLDITRKQFYSRISALQKTGLITRKNRQYVLTSLATCFDN